MPVPPDKARRRQLRDQYRRAESEARAAALPMDRAQLTELVGFVDRLLASDGCDHSLRHTLSWVESHGLPWRPIADGLAELGGHCDCEVVMNCDPQDVFDQTPDKFLLFDRPKFLVAPHLRGEKGFFGMWADEIRERRERKQQAGKQNPTELTDGGRFRLYDRRIPPTQIETPVPTGSSRGHRAGLGISRGVSGW